MENTGKNNIEEIRIQGLLDGYLNRKISSATTSTGHLDEDSLTAFVEGNLGEREATPIVSHLVDCSFCRHVTGELVKLEMAFADEPVHAPAIEAQPTKISEVLSGLLSKIFGTSDSAVFAHQEDEKPEDAKADDSEPGKN